MSDVAFCNLQVCDCLLYPQWFTARIKFGADPDYTFKPLKTSARWCRSYLVTSYKTVEEKKENCEFLENLIQNIS